MDDTNRVTFPAGTLQPGQRIHVEGSGSFPLPGAPKAHSISAERRYDADDRTVTDAATSAESYARDCSCGWHGVMWSTPFGALAEWTKHATGIDPREGA